MAAALLASGYVVVGVATTVVFATYTPRHFDTVGAGFVALSAGLLWPLAWVSVVVVGVAEAVGRWGATKSGRKG